LYTFRGRGCEKEFSLDACDNDEKDGQPLNQIHILNNPALITTFDLHVDKF
jgi:hypothetical protein